MDEKVNKITVNDGNGLYDNAGLIDTLIIDCNDLPKALFGGQYVKFCALIVQMVQKLGALKQAIKNEKESDEERYQDMKQLCERLANGEELTQGGDANVGD